VEVLGLVMAWVVEAGTVEVVGVVGVVGTGMAVVGVVGVGVVGEAGQPIPQSRLPSGQADGHCVIGGYNKCEGRVASTGSSHTIGHVSWRIAAMVLF
jgi:hypothetical protein